MNTSPKEPNVTQPTAAEPCTTWSANRRHYSTTLTTHPHGGRRGRTLCHVAGGNGEAYDDDAINEVLLRARLGKPPIVSADLPECKACARALTKLEN